MREPGKAGNREDDENHENQHVLHRGAMNALGILLGRTAYFEREESEDDGNGNLLRDAPRAPGMDLEGFEAGEIEREDQACGGDSECQLAQRRAELGLREG